MSSTGLLYNVLLFNFFAVIYIIHQANSSSNGTFETELTSALEECSVPLPTAVETNLSSFRTARLTMNKDPSSITRGNGSGRAEYRHSNNEYDDYGNDETNTNKRNPNGRSYSTSFSEDNADDDDDNAGNSNSNSRSSGSRGFSNTENNQSGLNSQSKNKTSDSKDTRNNNSTNGRKKADIKISNDDNSNYRTEDPNMRDLLQRNGYSNSNNKFSSSKSSNSSKGLQQALERQKRSLRFPRETYNTGQDGVPACTIQCALSRIEVVDEKGFPSELSIVTYLEASIRDEEQRITAIRDVRDCFVILGLEIEEDNCAFSKKLTDCMGLKFKISNVNVTDNIGTLE